MGIPNGIKKSWPSKVINQKFCIKQPEILNTTRVRNLNTFFVVRINNYNLLQVILERKNRWKEWS